MTSSDQPEFLAVLVTFRRPDNLRKVLSSVAAQTRPPDHVYVVDNDPDRTAEACVKDLISRGPLVGTYLNYGENLGPSGATAKVMQRVMAEGHGEDTWLMRLDDDQVLDDTGLFEEMFQFAQTTRAADPKTSAVGRAGARYDSHTGRLVRLRTAELMGAVPVDYVATGHLAMFHMDGVRAVGPFDASLFYGATEVEYGLRLRRAGHSVYVNGDLLGRSRAKSGRDDDRGLGRARIALGSWHWKRYYSLRNHIIILRRSGNDIAAFRFALVHGLLKPMLNAPVAPVRALHHLRGNLRAISDGLRGRSGRRVDPSSAD